MKHKRPFNQVMPIAEKVVGALSKYCERIEIAGSLRRQAAEVGDIEILAIPIMHTNLFGDVDPKLPTMLDEYLGSLLGDSIQHVAPRKRWGGKLKSFTFQTSVGEMYQVDLFIQSPETWGVNMMIRTGSSGFSRRMVTSRSKGGWMPDGMFISGARLHGATGPLSTPDEHLVFEAMGKEWVEPKMR